MVVVAAFYPLDQLVMRAQAATEKGKSGGPLRAMLDVIATEGVSGLYRGLGSTLFTLFAANFIYFYAFHLMRAVAMRNQRLRRLGKVAVYCVLLSTAQPRCTPSRARSAICGTLVIGPRTAPPLLMTINLEYLRYQYAAADNGDNAGGIKFAAGHHRGRDQRLLRAAALGRECALETPRLLHLCQRGPSCSYLLAPICCLRCRKRWRAP